MRALWLEPASGCDALLCHHRACTQLIVWSLAFSSAKEKEIIALPLKLDLLVAVTYVALRPTGRLMHYVETAV